MVTNSMAVKRPVAVPCSPVPGSQCKTKAVGHGNVVCKIILQATRQHQQCASEQGTPGGKIPPAACPGPDSSEEQGSCEGISDHQGYQDTVCHDTSLAATFIRSYARILPGAIEFLAGKVDHDVPAVHRHF